jgi:hypothetical protein
MDGKWFSQAYEKPPVGRANVKGERKELLQPIFDWSDSFSLVLHTVLRGDTFSPDDVNTFIGDYSLWLKQDFDTLAGDATTAEMNHSGKSINQGLINFHKLNADFLPIWWRVMQGHDTIPTDAALAVQNNLAARAVLMMPSRDEAIEQHMYFGEKNRVVRDNFNGFMNEIDTAIMALEISREHPSMAVLPSPTQFLISPDKGRNTNFVVVDLETKNARGIQARLSVSEDNMEDTDHDYVTNIDGKVDFASTRFMRTDRSSGRIVPWPGLIAAHHLDAEQRPIAADKDTKATMRREISHKRELRTTFVSSALRVERAKVLAERHLSSTSSVNDVAAKIVIKRVMDELEPAE